MKNRGRWKSVVTAGALCVALTGALAACGGGSPSEQVKTKGKPVTWEKACGGIFSADTLTQLRKETSSVGSLPQKTVYEVREGSAKDAFAAAGKALSASPDDDTHHVVCRLEGKDAKALVTIDFFWGDDDFSEPAEPHDPHGLTHVSKTFAYLWVNTFERQVNIDCRRPGSTPAGSHPATLHGDLHYRDGFDDRSTTQALYASAAQILPSLHCTNDVTVPTELPNRDPRLK